MLRELVELAERLEGQGDLIPLGYREFSSPVNWVLDISEDPPTIREAELTGPRPNRKRTSAIRPLLLADYAYYVLGTAEEDKEDRAQKAHEAFLGLLEDAHTSTDVTALGDALEHLHSGDVQIPPQLEPRDIVAIVDGGSSPLYDYPELRSYWQAAVSEEFLSEREGTCSVCGTQSRLLRTLPEDVAIMEETCQISSFNKSAFKSYGFDQTLNASLCYSCGARAAQALNHLTKSDDQRLRITEDQLAVFWTTVEGIETEEGQTVDLEALLGTAMAGDPGDQEESSRPSLAQVRELLELPWTAREASLRVENNVHIAVLSPNRSRLVVREWIQSSPEELKANLRRFLDAQRIQGPWGESPMAFGLRQLIAPLEAQTIDTDSRSIGTQSPAEPNLVRGLLRSAYKGHPPPVQLEARIVSKLQNPKLWKVPWLTHRSMALLNLARNHQGTNTMDEPTTERLDTDTQSTAYRCGRLLAVLEDAQRQAQGWDLNTTIVDRNFTAAATAPATTMPRLLNLAETAHLPKIRRERGTDEYVREAIEDIVSAIDGFPSTLDTTGQGDFALGFYHERAEIRRRREAHQQTEDEPLEAQQ